MDGAVETRAAEKRRRLEDALGRGLVMIHLDARRPGVSVPPRFAEDFHLRLNLSYRYQPPDLTTTDWGVRETLSFGGQGFRVAVPWSAIFAITGAGSEENAWLFPEDMPRELFEDAARHFGLTGEDVAVAREEASGRPLRPASAPQEAPAAPAERFKPRVVPSREDDAPGPEDTGGKSAGDKSARRSHLRVIK